jgi:hypothetical protein
VLFEVGSNGDRRAPHPQGNCVKTETRNQAFSNPSFNLHSKSYLVLTHRTELAKNIKPSHSTIIKMAPPTDRKEILAAFWKQIDSGTAIVGAGAGMQDMYRNLGCSDNVCSPSSFLGIGLTAKSAEAGGISLIIIYNRYDVSAHVP